MAVKENICERDTGFARIQFKWLQNVGFEWRKMVFYLSLSFASSRSGSRASTFKSALGGKKSLTQHPRLARDQQGVWAGDHSPYKLGPKNSLVLHPRGICPEIEWASPPDRCKPVSLCASSLGKKIVWRRQRPAEKLEVAVCNGLRIRFKARCSCVVRVSQEAQVFCLAINSNCGGV